MNIETERLIIKQTSMDEFNLICSLEKDEEVMKYIGKGARTDKEIIEGIEKSINHYKKHKFSTGSIYEKETGNFVGRGGLFHLEWNDASQEIELGYRFLKKYWGKGYATELSRCFLEYGFNNLNLNEIVAVIFQGNDSSAYVLKKIGMKYAGIITYANSQVEKYTIKK